MSTTEAIVWRSAQAKYQEDMSTYYIVEVWVSGMVPGEEWRVWSDPEKGINTIHESVAIDWAKKVVGASFVLPSHTGRVLHSRVRKLIP